MKYSFKPSGVCSRRIDIETEDGRVKSVSFLGGCDGNAKALSKIMEGYPVDEAVTRLFGIDCDGRGTSCPDQFAKALKKMQELESEKMQDLQTT